MKRRQKKLALNKETLRRLSADDLRRAGGAADYSIQGGETCCWCTDTCNCSNAIAGCETQIRFQAR
jgi:hypothetical protein